MKTITLLIVLVFSSSVFSQSIGIELGDPEYRVIEMQGPYFKILEKGKWNPEDEETQYSVRMNSGGYSSASIDFFYSFKAGKCIRVVKLIPERRIRYLLAEYKRMDEVFKVEPSSNLIEWVEKQSDGKYYHSYVLNKSNLESRYLFFNEYASKAMIKEYDDLEQQKIQLEEAQKRKEEERKDNLYKFFLKERETNVYDRSTETIPENINQAINNYHKNLQVDHKAEFEVTYFVDTLGQSKYELEITTVLGVDTSIICKILEENKLTKIEKYRPYGVGDKPIMSINYKKTMKFKFEKENVHLVFKASGEFLKYKDGDYQFFQNNNNLILKNIVNESNGVYDVDYVKSIFAGVKLEGVRYYQQGRMKKGETVFDGVVYFVP